MISFLRRLRGRPLGRAKNPENSKLTLSAADEMATIKAQGSPCLRLIPGGSGCSRLGGVPDMSSAWPRYEGRPLCCVAQLDLAEMRSAGGPAWLPDQGRLLFFYELEHAGWGLDPEDAGRAVVIYETGLPVEALEPDDLAEEARFPAYPITFVADVSYPTEERVSVDWNNLSPTESTLLSTAIEGMAPAAPMHQVGGYPQPVQDDQMELECQTATAGLRRLANKPGSVSDWRLLLQLDTDDDAGMMWCDVGSLYFWVREQDARDGDFSAAWMILQSS